MSDSTRFVMDNIHNINRPRVFGHALIHDSHTSIIKQHHGLIRSGRKFNPLELGVHEFEFASNPGKKYLINIDSKLDSYNVVILNNKDDITLHNKLEDSKSKIRAYKKVNEINSINDYMDHIIVAGNTSLIYKDGTAVQSVENPCKLKSISTLDIKSKNEDSSESSICSINIKRELSALPSGVFDYLVISNYNKTAYIVYNTAHLFLSGNENITKVDSFSNSTHNAYFIKHELSDKYSTKDDVICDRFISEDYEIFRKKEYKKESICVSTDDWRSRGFYFKVDKNKFPTLESFVSMIKDANKTDPIDIIYKLQNSYKTIISLDSYKIKTYYPKTIIECDQDLSLFFRSSIN